MHSPVARIALVGDRSADVQAHGRIPGLIASLLERDGLALDAYWLASDAVQPGSVAGFDGVWVPPGSPYRSETGVIAAIRDAREGGIPFLGTCGGFQHALLEFARSVCGIDATHAESDPQAPDPLIVPLECSLVGHQLGIDVASGSLAERVLETDRTVERYLCAFGPSPDYLSTLAEHGLRFSGHDDDGEPRMAELPGHPFFLTTLFQPELSDEHARAHPIVRAFAQAAVARAAQRLPIAV